MPADTATADPALTVRRDPHDPCARLAIRTTRGPLPWITVTGPDAGEPLSDLDVAGWPIAHPAAWSPQLRRDLAHLRTFTRKETA